MKVYYTITDIAEQRGCGRIAAARWIERVRKTAIEAGELPPEFPKGIIPAAVADRIDTKAELRLLLEELEQSANNLLKALICRM
ncbi:MAG: hypothetical protein IKQ49_06285 [Eubacterium sp.]|nr:hypothetical protein [Eubacterium sp.]